MMRTGIKIFFIAAFLFCNCKSGIGKAEEKNKTIDPSENNRISESFIPDQIEAYTVFIREIENKPGFIILRKFTDAKTKKEYGLLIEANSLETTVAPIDQLKIQKDSSFTNTINSTYFKLRKRIASKNYNSSGIDSGSNNGYCLTMDLCPSTKSFDKDFFDFIKANHIAPYYICISGKWIEKHQSELKYIVNNSRENNIVWASHSYNHYYDPKKPLNQNFMLSSTTNFDTEVLYNEKTMLVNKLIPSPFFRFPGLICDAALCKKIISYGLIPLSSNAWLAKGEKPKNGSIVLLHLNGNERPGLDLFRKFFENTKMKAARIQ